MAGVDIVEDNERFPVDPATLYSDNSQLALHSPTSREFFAADNENGGDEVETGKLARAVKLPSLLILKPEMLFDPLLATYRYFADEPELPLPDPELPLLPVDAELLDDEAVPIPEQEVISESHTASISVKPAAMAAFRPFVTPSQILGSSKMLL
jgi:hypothetical protein